LRWAHRAAAADKAAPVQSAGCRPVLTRGWLPSPASRAPYRRYHDGWAKVLGLLELPACQLYARRHGRTPGDEDQAAAPRCLRQAWLWNNQLADATWPAPDRPGQARRTAWLLIPADSSGETLPRSPSNRHSKGMLNSAAGPRSGAGPLHQQQGGVVAQAAALTLEHGPHQAAQQFFARPAAGGFPLQQVDQPVQPELLPSAVRASVTPSVYKSTTSSGSSSATRGSGAPSPRPNGRTGSQLSSATILRPRSSSSSGCGCPVSRAAIQPGHDRAGLPPHAGQG
jgi:hypothetical protein